MNSLCIDDAPSTDIDERRRSTRFVKHPESSFALLVGLADDPLIVEVHDESLGGVGLLVAGCYDCRPGQTLDVVFAGSYMHSTVRHIEPHDGGLQLIGLDCDPDE